MVTQWATGTTNLLQKYYEKSVRTLLNEGTVLSKYLDRSKKGIRGSQLEIAYTLSRGTGRGSRGAGDKMPKRGKPSFGLCYATPKYDYGRFYVDGPSVEAHKGDKAAFADLVDRNVRQLTLDKQMDQERQFFGDGSGFLAVNQGTSETGTTGNAIAPYIWSPAGRYFTDTPGLSMQSLTATDGTTLDPASSDTDTAALDVLSTSTSAKFYWENGTWASAVAGDPLGMWREVQDGDVQYCCMGLAGIVSDSNLVFDYTWYYPGEVTAVMEGSSGRTSQKWTNPEIEAVTAGGYTYALTGIDQTLQGIDANSQSLWRSYVLGNAGQYEPLSLSKVDKVINYQRYEVGIEPDLILCSPGVLLALKNELRANKYYIETKEIDGGFKASMYEGIPIVASKDAGRGRMYFLNMASLELRVLKDWSFVGGGQMGENLILIADYDAFESYLKSYKQMVTNNRRANALYCDISEPA